MTRFSEAYRGELLPVFANLPYHDAPIGDYLGIDRYPGAYPDMLPEYTTSKTVGEFVVATHVVDISALAATKDGTILLCRHGMAGGNERMMQVAVLATAEDRGTVDKGGRHAATLEAYYDATAFELLDRRRAEAAAAAKVLAERKASGIIYPEGYWLLEERRQRSMDVWPDDTLREVQCDGENEGWTMILRKSPGGQIPDETLYDLVGVPPEARHKTRSGAMFLALPQLEQIVAFTRYALNMTAKS